MAVPALVYRAHLAVRAECSWRGQEAAEWGESDASQ